MSRKYKKTYQTTQNPNEPSPSVQSNAKDEDEFSPLDLVKYLVCGPEKDNPKPLTFGVCLRRFFTVLDNLIAAALVFYVLTWIKFYSNGADTSFDVVIGDMSTLSFKNAVGLLLIIAATWRWLCYGDSLPCLKNFTYPMPYVFCVVFIVGFSFFNLIVWLRLLAAHGFDIDSISQPVGGIPNYNDHVFDYLPFWAQEIRIVILSVVFMIRRLLLNDTDMDF